MSLLSITAFSSTLLILSACAPIHLADKQKVETTDSCLSQQKHLNPYSGRCFAAKGDPEAPNRFLFTESTPFFDTFESEVISICLYDEENGSTRSDSEIYLAIESWLEPIRDLLPNPEIQVLIKKYDSPESLKEECHEDSIKIRRDALGTSTLRNYWIANKGDYYETFEEPFVSFNYLLNNIGRVFGLADTYDSRTDSCRKGFPNSLMCESRWGHLLPVDKEQVRRSYCLHIDGEHPECFNYEKTSILGLRPEEHKGRYFHCSMRGKSIEFKPNRLEVSEGRWPKEYLAYSHDEISIQETFIDNSYQVTMITESEVNENSPGEAIKITLNQSGLILETEKDREIFPECLLDEAFRNFLVRQGVSIPSRDF